jgi:hypothetical protein
MSGASFHAINAVIGDRLGLYRSLLAVMPATPAEVEEPRTALGAQAGEARLARIPDSSSSRGTSRCPPAAACPQRLPTARHG